jgi:hypothetical protein
VALVFALIAFQRKGGETEVDARVRELQMRMEKMREETAERVSKVRQETKEALEKIGVEIRREKGEQ